MASTVRSCRPIGSQARSLPGIVLAGVLLASSGCGSEPRSPNATAEMPTSARVFAPVPAARPVPAAKAEPAAAAPRMPGMMGGMMSGMMGAPEVLSDKGGEPASDAPPAIPRKIIYNARLTLIVESITSLSERLAKIVKDAGGYVSETDQSGSTHAQRTSTWTVRIPVEKFDDVLDGLGRLGEVQQFHKDSQDVSQEYYDTEARILNKQQEEKRLLKHLAESTGKLQDILAVERELTRVRGEIETMQGRIRYLGSLSSLSTVTVTATEVADFKPPVQPTFGTEIARTFNRSLETLVDAAKQVVLAVVALAPWLPLLVVLALLMLLVWRRLRAAWREQVVLTPTNPPA